MAATLDHLLRCQNGIFLLSIPNDPEPRRRRFRTIPVRLLLPNMITLLSLCAGLTAIRLAIEGRIEWALGAIVFAAALDGVDGRVARMLKGTVALWGRARQPRGLRQFRRGARPSSSISGA